MAIDYADKHLNKKERIFSNMPNVLDLAKKLKLKKFW